MCEYFNTTYKIRVTPREEKEKKKKKEKERSTFTDAANSRSKQESKTTLQEGYEG